MKKVISILFLIWIGIGLTSCSKKDKLIGKWVLEDSYTEISLTFKEDGTAIYGMGSYTAEGSYSIDHDLLFFDFEDIDDLNTNFTFVVNGDVLTITSNEDEEEVTTFQRQ